jgi:hypothetical protein
MQTQNLILLGLMLTLTLGIVATSIPTMLYADSPFKDNPSDDDNGSGNDPEGHAPGQTNNPNPSK